MIKLCTKFDGSQTIHSEVIDDLVHFRCYYVTLWL